MSDKKKFRIVSDGTQGGTRVEFDGTPVAGVRSVRWSIDAGTGQPASVNIELWGDFAEIDVVGEEHTP